MFERSIAANDVRHVLENGEAIEDHPDDHPYPSRLVLRRASDRALHVVAAEAAESGETIVITGHEPDPAQWGPDLRRRKS